jgi:thiamine-phosphate pyrophosphorylase
MSSRDWPALVRANACRAGEALRTIEEMGKLPSEVSADPRLAKAVRFQVYELERDLSAAVDRSRVKKFMSGLYLIADVGLAGPSGVLAATKAALAAGVRLVQLRDKQEGKKSSLALARQVKTLTKKSGALFLINNDVDVALACGADGVHIGQDDLPLKVVRQLMPPGAVIGVTVRDVAMARSAEKAGADYVSVGCLFGTQTKHDAIATSIKTLKAVCRAVDVPVAGIGGINDTNIQQVRSAGAKLFAVAGAIVMSPNPKQAVRLLSLRLRKAKNGKMKGHGAS